MKKKLLLALLACLMVFAFAACGSSDDAAEEGTDEGTAGIPAEDIKVGFIYIGPADDQGFSNSHDDARLALEETLGVETTYLEEVPDNADSEKAIRDLIDMGCNVIVGCSFGYGDAMAKVAEEYPDIYFFHATGNQSNDTNFVNFMGRMYKSRYLSGIVAGLQTESNQIGYVAAFGIPEVVRGINAFTLGVRSVNPDATVEVKWTGSWGDSAAEKTAAIELVNNGCDVLTYHQDTTSTQLAAQEKGVYCVGYHYPTPDVAPDSYLTSAIWDWTPYYVDQIQKIIDGTWTAENFWGEEVVSLDTLTALCSPDAQAKVDEAKAKMEAGDWDVFYGPINDQNGEVKVPEGSSMTDEEMLSFDWFVEGVKGSIEN